MNPGAIQGAAQHAANAPLTGAPLAGHGLWQGGTPFIDPMNIHDQWWLTVIPLVFLVAMAYKGTRVQDLAHYWRQVWLMTLQTLIGLILFAFGVHVLLEWIIPLLRG
ncbi:MAG: hypothetical protein KDA20_08240 [Phycisphaerales bacterium]|nr:hypothetical protein [Phycisphaerales bacterium]